MVGAGLSNTSCWAVRKLASAAARLTAWFCDGHRGAAGQAQRRGEVTAGGAAPGADVGLGDAEAGLDEADQRRVVEHIGADIAADRPRGNDDRRDPEAEADRQP